MRCELCKMPSMLLAQWQYDTAGLSCMPQMQALRWSMVLLSGVANCSGSLHSRHDVPAAVRNSTSWRLRVLCTDVKVMSCADNPCAVQLATAHVSGIKALVVCILAC